MGFWNSPAETGGFAGNSWWLNPGGIYIYIFICALCYVKERLGYFSDEKRELPVPFRF